MKRRLQVNEMNLKTVMNEVIASLGIPAGEINNGFSEDFAEQVVKRFGAETDNFCIVNNNTYKVCSGSVDSMYCVWDHNLLSELNIELPHDLTLSELNRFDEPQHTWIYLNGFYYDAEETQGVSSFFDLPVFKRTFYKPSLEYNFAPSFFTDTMLEYATLSTNESGDPVLKYNSPKFYGPSEYRPIVGEVDFDRWTRDLVHSLATGHSVNNTNLKELGAKFFGQINFDTLPVLDSESAQELHEITRDLHGRTDVY